MTTTTSVVTEIVRIDLAQTDSGLFVATSKDVPGLFVTHRDVAAIRSDMPTVIRAMYRRLYGLDVTVVEARHGADRGSPSAMPDWVALPAHIAADAMRGHA